MQGAIEYHPEYAVTACEKSPRCQTVMTAKAVLVAVLDTALRARNGGTAHVAIVERI